MHKKINLCILLWLVFFSSKSQILKYSNDFLNIGVNAANIAMGNSTTAINDNISAAYNNPAALYLLNSSYQASLMHAEYYLGMVKHDYVAFGLKLNDSSSLAFSAIRYAIDDIQNTLFLIDENGNVNYDNITYFSTADYALWLSYSQKSKIPNLAIGGSFYIIYRHIGNFSNGFGFRVDAAIHYKIKKWMFGGVLTNATTSYTAWFVNIDEKTRKIFEQTNNEIPKNFVEITTPQLNTGIGRTFIISETVSLTSELDLNLTFDGKRSSLLKVGFVGIYPQFGAQVGIRNIFYIRSGIKNLQLAPNFKANDTTNNYFRPKNLYYTPSLGAGIEYKGFCFDYSFGNFNNGSSIYFSHIVSITMKF